MEIQLTLTFFSTLLLSSIFFLVRACMKPKLSVENEKLPPSPPKLPVIGHLHLLLGGLQPHRALYSLAQKYGPILYLQLGEVPTVVISSREAVRQMLKDQDPACAGRPESMGSKIFWYDSSDIVFSPFNEYWKQMRKICISELLSARKVKSFWYIRKEEISLLLESLLSSSGQAINLTEKLYALSSSVISRAAFGKKIQDADVLIAMLREATALTVGFQLADFFPSSKLLNVLSWNKHKLLRMRSKFDTAIDGIVEDHKLKQRGEFDVEDIVDALLRVKENKQAAFPVTVDNIKAIIFDMFSASTDPSSATMDWSMAELMRNPRVMTKLQEEIREAFKGKKEIREEDMQGLKYLKLVIKETLRLHPPVPIILRACRDKCEVDGYSIPLKSKVIVNVWSMGRDPQYWEEPETFQPERFEGCSVDFLGNNSEYIPFGIGKRMCPGVNFALANVELVLAQLLYHFDWEMGDGTTIDMTEGEGIAVPRKNGLNLVPTVYHASYG